MVQIYNPRTGKPAEVDEERYKYSWETYGVMGQLASGIGKLKLNKGRKFEIKLEIPTKVFNEMHSDMVWDEPKPSKKCPENITQLVLHVERGLGTILKVFQNADQMKAQSLQSKAK